MKKTGVTGNVRSQVKLEDKNTGHTKKVLSSRKNQFRTDLLIGDGKARVKSSAYFRQGIDYNSLVFGIEVGVELTCNQDDKTINRALKIATHIAKKEVDRNEKLFDDVLGLEEEG